MLSTRGQPSRYLSQPSNFHFVNTRIPLNYNTSTQTTEDEITWRSYIKDLPTTSLVWYNLLLLLKFDLGRPLSCNPAMVIPPTPPISSSTSLIDQQQRGESQEAGPSGHHLDSNDDALMENVAEKEVNNEDDEDHQQSRKRKRTDADQEPRQRINKGKGKRAEKDIGKGSGKGKGIGKGKGVGKGKGIGKGSINSIKKKLARQQVDKIQKTDLVFIDPPEGLVVKDSPHEL